MLRACAAVLLACGVARAAPAPHELRWERREGAEGCIDEETLRAAVERSLGHSLDTGDAAIRIIEGRVTPDGGGYRAQLVVRDEAGTSLGERELHEDGDCRALDESLVLVISLIVDPEASPRSARASSAIVTPPTQVVVPAGASPVRVAGGLGAIGALGFLPGVSAGIRGDLEVRVHPLPALVVSPTFWLPDEARVPRAGSRLVAAVLGTAMCPDLATFGRASIRACVGVDVGFIRASGIDVAISRTEYRIVVAGRAELELVRPLGAAGGVRAVIAGGIVVPAVRPRFVADDGDDVLGIYEVPAVHGTLRVGVSIQL